MKSTAAKITRLDKFLVEAFSGISRRRARLACENGTVFVNGRTAKAGSQLLPGDEVRLFEDPRRPAAREGDLVQGLNLDVLFEDDDLLVVNKPREVHSVTLRHEDPPTLADMLAEYCEDCRNSSPDPREAGLVNRLDYFTSGCALAAKKPEVWFSLREKLFDGKIKKTYLALVEGAVAISHTEVSLALAQGERGRFMRPAKKGDLKTFPSESEVDLLKVFEPPSFKGAFSLVRVSGTRMRRHQVRTHLSFLGHPLIGDDLYGATRSLKDLGSGLERGFLLHAERISFSHPLSDRPLDILSNNTELFQ